MTWTTDVDQQQADNAIDWGSFTLGVASVTPMDMAAAYATLAADGMYTEPTPIDELHDVNGNEVAFTVESERILDVEVARAAVDASRCTTGYGAAKGSCSGGTATQLAGMVGGPVAGKTGTTDGDSTAWFTGFTPNHAVASFMADPDDPMNFLPGGTTVMPTNVSGQILAAGWRADPSGEFTPPEDLVGNGYTHNDGPGSGLDRVLATRATVRVTTGPGTTHPVTTRPTRARGCPPSRRTHRASTRRATRTAVVYSVGLRRVSNPAATTATDAIPPSTSTECRRSSGPTAVNCGTNAMG